MKKTDVKAYRCPQTGEELSINEATTTSNTSEGALLSGELRTATNNKYMICDGIPDFSYPPDLGKNDEMSRQEYDIAANEYDEMQKITFSILCQDEVSFRRDMVKQLRLKKKSVVIETAAGTGLNIPYIQELLAGEGDIYVQDISLSMLKQSRKYDLQHIRIHRSIGNAAYLPFSENQFDAALSFGGIGVYSDQERAIKEMFRVVKPGGRIVFGDEGVAPWLRESDYGKKLISNNHFYSDEPPINYLPIEAREMNVQWVMGGAFYLVSLTVGEGEPKADFDYPIPGHRGGTINTRYNGRLEGVSEATKKLAQLACKKTNISMHQWLDDLVKKAAEEIIGSETDDAEEI